MRSQFRRSGFIRLAMIRAFRQITPRTFWIVALAAALVLGAIVAIPQSLSKQARLEVLRSHVREVAQLASTVIDGDLHRQLIDPANYSDDLYQRTLAPLVRFHSADPDIFYVYTMVERDGKAYFVVDTATSKSLVTRQQLRPSAYMEEFASIDAQPDPDWLQRIAAGQSYVSPRFLHDEYGYFLSGHAPILDSEKRYSGFVGVDFDIQYYLAQEAHFTKIYVGTFAAAMIVALLIAYLAARFDYHAQHRIEEQYQFSIRDSLTQLYNRRGALAAVRKLLAAGEASYATILADVDDLKGINDSNGHAAGDVFLAKVADAMRSSVRDADICARLGGDEFMIFAANCSLDVATEIAQRVLAKVYAPDDTPGRRPFGVSIGICVAARPHAEFEMMYRHADQALYQAKARGKNRYVVFEEMAAAS
jgi:diguanylate cyclase (GGDEF)-like protein